MSERGGGGLYEEIVDIYFGPLQIGLFVQNGNRGGGGSQNFKCIFLGGGVCLIFLFLGVNSRFWVQAYV